MIKKNSNDAAPGTESTENKVDELSALEERPGSVSNMTSTQSLKSSTGTSVNMSEGNLLSNVPPPSELPTFISNVVPQTTVSTVLQPIQTANDAQPLLNITSNVDATEHFYPTEFSPAIPPSKGIPQGELITPSSSSLQEDSDNGLFGWIKDAVTSGGILAKVAEKAKSSVDSMITTLDPQMKEFILSGGDVDILVASDSEMKLSAIREAFQSVFGKATVSGLSVQISTVAEQPVGFTAGVKAAEEKLVAVYSEPQSHPLPVIAIENFLLEVGLENKWYDLSVMILSDPAQKIYLQTFTQMIPVPSTVVSVLKEDTPADYSLKESGFSTTVDKLMAKNLQVQNTSWQQALTGISQRESILLTAKVLAGLYKSSLNQV